MGANPRRAGGRRRWRGKRPCPQGAGAATAPRGAFGGEAFIERIGIDDPRGGSWPDYYAAAADVCLWDILGKAVDQPIYKILSAARRKDRVMAYASSQHLATVKTMWPTCSRRRRRAIRATRSIPGAAARQRPSIPSYIGHMEEIREVRKAVGDEFVLMHDPVQATTATKP